MKKYLIFLTAVAMLSACGMMSSSSSSQSSTTQAQTPANANAKSTGAMQSGQGAGNALQALYAQYKADGNKYDYKNLQNILNTLTLITNCEGLKDNYTDKSYLKDFGKGLIVSSLGLVTQSNMETVTNSLVDIVKNSEPVQSATSEAQSTVATAASYAGTAAQYASAISTLLGAFGGK